MAIVLISRTLVFFEIGIYSDYRKLDDAVNIQLILYTEVLTK